MSQHEWLTDLLAAANELGYLVVSFDSDSIELAPLRPHHGETVTISGGPFISGDMLRRTLRPLEEPAPA